MEHMTWGLFLAQSFMLGITLAALWFVNQGWYKFTKRMSEEHHAEQKKLIDGHYERSKKLLDEWKLSLQALNSDWDDAMREAFGKPPKRRSSLIEIPRVSGNPLTSAELNELLAEEPLSESNKT